MKYSGIGGQAVIEGIMMKNKDQYATAVRRPDGGIEVKKDTYVSMTEKGAILRTPLCTGRLQLCGFHDPRHADL